MMETLEKIGDGFNAFTAGVERVITRMFGASNERQMRRLGFVRRGDVTTITPGSLLDKINQQEEAWKARSDEELRQTAVRMRERLQKGETLDSIMPDVFAAVREAGRRFLRMRHYDVQMIGGYILHSGRIAEMVTGEGKTLVATLPATLNAMAGKVHLVTVNDYLARRDMEWMAPLYMGLGLTVGAIQAHQPGDEKLAAYNCDITYGTNNEFGFDYLRDNMKPARKGDPNYSVERQQVQGPLTFAIVDEIDNILIDEARTPLIISGPAEDDPEKYRKADRIARLLQKDKHFEVKEKEHTCHLTEEGVRYAEEQAGVESFYTAGNMQWPHLIDNALRAHHLYKRDVNYVVMEGEIIIVDEFTGRLMKGRQWSDGLHQAVEAKEGVKIKEESQTYATITLQNYFKLYKKLCGMTGTAMTEANEFWKIYKLDVVAVPSNRPMKRINYEDVIYRTEREKFNAIVEEIKSIHGTGRPILVGTTSIEKSELVSHKLEQFGIPHSILNAKQHEREANIIAQAGRLNAVTIATNMAGRGTDIILGGNPDAAAWEELKTKYATRLDIPKEEWDGLTSKIANEEGMVAEGRKVAELGGLHVVGTERHEARRIDLQLRGRSGRQGDPGSSRFFLSLEDDLMRIFAGEWVKSVLTWLGMQEGEPIESGMVSRRIEGAQKKVEERNFDIRKNLLEYDEVMDTQRKRVYGFRQRILDGENCRDIILGMIRDQVTEAVNEILNPKYPLETAARWAQGEFGIEVEAADLRGMSSAEVQEFLRDQAVRQADEVIRDKIEEDLPEEVEDEREWSWNSLAGWANRKFQINTNDRELKKIGRDGVFDYLIERATEAYGRLDLSDVEKILAEDMPRKSLSGFVASRFNLEIPPEQFESKLPEEIREFILDALTKLYQQREVEFPVGAAIHRYLAVDPHSGGERGNRDGLVTWANHRFHAGLDTDEIRAKSRDEIYSILRNTSERFYRNGEVTGKVDSLLDDAYGKVDGDEAESARVRQPGSLGQLVEWANRELDSSLTTEELLPLSRAAARRRLMEEVDLRYRPELSHAERGLLLEVLDTAWKDHLYYMDHLRQGIGLVGYAQKDPKVEYKREGMRAFESMWKRIAVQVTGSIFRLEEAEAGFSGDMWQISQEIHSEAQSALSGPGPDAGGAEGMPEAHSPDAAVAVEPIRNFGTRVGRNDPCPCGSGKKFKNCCMKR